MKILKAWEPFFLEQQKQPYWPQLWNNLKEAQKRHVIRPQASDIFRLFLLVKPEDVKVVILGQDPYHGRNQADGLAFSVANNLPTPPSLQNIFKELKNDLNINHPQNSLEGWAKQGVFLLNATLTVNLGEPNSHQNFGWAEFVVNVLRYVHQKNPQVVFLLFGSSAKTTYNKLNLPSPNYVVAVGHPSPFSYDKYFKNSHPFSKVNQILKQLKQIEIDWSQ